MRQGDRQVLLLSISLNLPPPWILIPDEISKSCLCGLISHLKDTKFMVIYCTAVADTSKNESGTDNPSFSFYVWQVVDKELPGGKWDGKYLKKIMPIHVSGLCITPQKKVRNPSLFAGIFWKKKKQTKTHKKKKQDKQGECFSTEEQRHFLGCVSNATWWEER